MLAIWVRLSSQQVPRIYRASLHTPNAKLQALKANPGFYMGIEDLNPVPPGSKPSTLTH